MSEKVIQPVRGTKDLRGEEAATHLHIVQTARRIASLYGCEEVMTPIIEPLEVFKRTLGDTSDVVNKEMYTFQDRGEEWLTLRPEFTAGIVRALLSNGWQQHLPLKCFSTGPLFRYERPQKGRQRQFHQVNVEWLGLGHPQSDVELMALAMQLLSELGISGTSIQLNTLGDDASRAAYREALVAYLSRYESELSPDSQERLRKNPLRVLDSKDPKDRKLVADAPVMTQFLTPEAQQFFETVQQGLAALSLPFTVNPHIVRGLDYYSHTVFEVVMESDQLGAQNTILAGGRYDGLIAGMGGNATPAVGFAAGIERLSLLIPPVVTKGYQVAVIAADGSTEKEALVMVQQLRHAGISAELLLQGGVGKRLQKADKQGAKFAVILGEQEVQQQIVTLKNLKNGEQSSAPRTACIDTIRKGISG